MPQVGAYQENHARYQNPSDMVSATGPRTGAIEQLEMIAKGMRERLEMLNDRLDPVLLPIGPEKPNDRRDGASTRLQTIINELALISDGIESLTRRIDL
jgi:hypothetical protein